MRSKLILSGVVTLAALAFPACAHHYYAGYPPPPVAVGVAGVAPGPRYVWVNGYWNWYRGYRWVPGQWVLPPRPRAVWVPGYWARRHGRYYWVGGCWR